MSPILLYYIILYYLPVVGSSKNIRLGLVNSSTPIDALLRSPPDTPLIILFPILVF